MRKRATSSRWSGLWDALGFGNRERQKISHLPKRRTFALERLERRELLAVCTWTGGGDNYHWSDQNNWLNDQQQHAAPQAGDSLVFQGTGTTTDNDLAAGTSFNGILFQSGGFALTGNDLALPDCGTVTTVSGVGSTTISTNMALDGCAKILVGSNSTLTVSGMISDGSGGLEKAGSGTLILAGTNTYTGDTTIDAGTLEAAIPDALPRYGTPGSFTASSGATVAVAAGGMGEWTSGQIDDLLSNSSFSSCNLGIDVAGGDNFEYPAAITGSYGIVKFGTGALTLSGDNTFTGGSWINQGTLTVGSGSALGASDNGILITGGTLDLNGFDVTAGAVTLDGGTIENTGANSAAGLLADSYVVMSGTVSANLAGKSAATSLVKGSSGEATLSGNNTYAGPTTVYAGTLTLVGQSMTTPQAWNPVLSGGGADIQGGQIVFDYSAGSTPASTVQELLTTSFDRAGTARFDIGQFRSSTADSSYGLGWVDDTAGKKLTVARALYGDANLDGCVNGADLNAVLSFYNHGPDLTWSQGDFNYDGYATGYELDLILSAYNQSAVPPGPQMVRISRLGSATTSDNSVQFVAIFSEGVSGVEPADFNVTIGGSATQSATAAYVDSTIESFGSGAVYLVTVDNVFATGTLGLTFQDPGATNAGATVASITDIRGASLTGPGALTQEAYSGDTYQLPFVWIGSGSNLWSNANNWLGGEIPAAGDGESVRFTTETSPSFPTGTSLCSIEIAASGFALGDAGTAIALANGITVDAGVTDSTILANIALGGPLIVNVGAGGSLTISGAVSDSDSLTHGSLTKTGSGTLTLTNDNTYSGGTTISGGTLHVGDGAWNTTGTLGSAASPVENDASLVFNRQDDATFANPISGSGTVTVDVFDTLTLTGYNNYTGLTTIVAGALELGVDAQGPVLSGGGVNIQGGKIYFDYTGDGTPLTESVEAALTYSYDGKRWDMGQFYCTTEDSDHGLGWTNVGPDAQLDPDPSAHVTVMRTLYGDANCDGVVNGIDLDAVLSHYNQSGNWSQGDFTYDGVVNGADCDLIDSQYNRGTSQAPSLLWSPGGSPVWDGTTANWLRLDSNGNPSGAPVCWTNGDVAVFDGAGETTVTISAGNVFASSIEFDRSGYVIDASGTWALTLPGDGTVIRVDNSGIATVNCCIIGPGALVKNGPGTLVLAGQNTYGGGTTVNDGQLSCLANGAIGAGAVTVSGGTLSLGSYSDTVGTVTLSGGGSITGTTGILTSTATFEMQSGDVSAILGGSGIALNKTTSGTVTLSGDNTYTGATTISAGTLQVGAGSTTGSLGTGAVVDNAALVFNRSNCIAVSSAISGGGSLTQEGSGGTLILSGANTYTGATTISAGTLQFGASNVISTGAVTVSGGTLSLGSYSDTVGTVTLSKGGSITGTTGILTSTGTFEMQNGDVSAILGGSGIALNKTTNGTVTLSGDNTYTGDTCVSQGELRIAGSIRLSSVSISGGTLSGPGTTGPVTVASGVLSPGIGGTGTISTGSLTFASGFNYNVDVVNGAYGEINVAGAVNLDNAVLNLGGNGQTNTPGEVLVLIAHDGTDAVTGTFLNQPEGSEVVADGATYTITYTYNAEAGRPGGGNDVALIALVAGTFSPPMVTADATAAIESYATQYNNILAANLSSFNAGASSPLDSTGYENYYDMQYLLDASLSMYEATKNVTYFEQALTWAETMIANARPDDSGYLSWPGSDMWLTINGQLAGCATQLTELQASTQLARIPAIVATNPQLACYQARTDAVLHFVEHDIIEKQFDHRADQWQEYAGYVYDPSEAVVDKTLLLMTVLVYLREADPGFTSTVPQQELNGAPLSDLWSDRLSYLLAGLEARFSEYSDNSIIWDYGLPYPETDVNSYDTSHANRMPALFDALYDAGDTTFSLSDYQKLANLLTGTIWTNDSNGIRDPNDPVFSNYIDGDNSVYRHYLPWANGFMYLGWIKLGRFDALTQDVMEGLFRAYTATPPAQNAGIAPAEQVGLLEEAAQLARNIALTQVVPTVGVAFGPTTVFHFTDADPHSRPSDYLATVVIGDVTLTSTANPDNVQIVANPNGGFDVQLCYTCPEELSGAAFGVTVQAAGAASAVSAGTNEFSVQGAAPRAASSGGAVKGGAVMLSCGAAVVAATESGTTDNDAAPTMTGSRVNVQPDAMVMVNGSSNADLDLCGELRMSHLTVDSQPSVLNFDGGMLTATCNLTPDSGLSYSLAADATATISTNGQIVMLPGVLTGDGGLTKTGSGTLVLGGADTHSGGTMVNQCNLCVMGNIGTILRLSGSRTRLIGEALAALLNDETDSINRTFLLENDVDNGMVYDLTYAYNGDSG